jgi:hypothetical protein
MYNVLNKLYESEIVLSKFIFIEINKNKNDNKHNTDNKNNLILLIMDKLNKILIDLFKEFDYTINNLLLLDNDTKFLKIKKFIKLEEYVYSYIINLKNEFKEHINVLYEDIDTDINNLYANNNIDKFYTNIHIVHDCLNQFKLFYNINNFDLVIEPSAGSGNFLLNITNLNKIGLDIKPEHNSIIKQDFFDYMPNTHIYKNILTIGNPPFGKVCSLAIKFFNHAALFSNIIAFIIPRSFRKISIQNKLNTKFILIYDNDISTKSDTFTPSVNVKCCFQIWIRNDSERIINKSQVKHNDWKFLNSNKEDIHKADFAIRAYGGKCGEIIENICINSFKNLNKRGWHFIKSNISKDILISRLKSLNYDLSKNTARQNSLGKAELIDLYKKI